MIIDSTRIPATMAASTIKALCHLAEVGDSSPTKLSKEIGISKAAVTTLICRLEDAGHAARAQVPDDRRATSVVITAAGRLFAEGLRPVCLQPTANSPQK
jgi:DNA-binding MarR family transcriptional regulator